MTDSKHLDKLCAGVEAGGALAALHACRPGHPLNHPYQFRNAQGMVSLLQHPPGTPTARAWLERQSMVEATNNSGDRT